MYEMLRHSEKLNENLSFIFFRVLSAHIAHPGVTLISVNSHWFPTLPSKPVSVDYFVTLILYHSPTLVSDIISFPFQCLQKGRRFFLLTASSHGRVK